MIRIYYKNNSRYPPPAEEKYPYVDIPYVSDMLQIGYETIRMMCANGELPATKVRGRYGRQWRIKKTDIEKYMEDNKVCAYQK